MVIVVEHMPLQRQEHGEAVSTIAPTLFIRHFHSPRVSVVRGNHVLKSIILRFPSLSYYSLDSFPFFPPSSPSLTSYLLVILSEDLGLDNVGHVQRKRGEKKGRSAGRGAVKDGDEE